MKYIVELIKKALLLVLFPFIVLLWLQDIVLKKRWSRRVLEKAAALGMKLDNYDCPLKG